MGRLMDTVPGRSIRKFLEDQAPNWAALIAWNALLALFPIVLFTASLLGFALRLFGEANDAVYKTIFSVIPNDTGQQNEGGQRQPTDQVQDAADLSGKRALLGLDRRGGDQGREPRPHRSLAHRWPNIR